MNQKTILRSVLAAVLSLVATAATAHDFEVNGIFYKYNGDGTVSVTYKGDQSYSYDDEYAGDVVIPSSVTYSGTEYPVTSIGLYAFANCSSLTSVYIPNSVTSIGESTFQYCKNLTSVTIPNSVTSIGNYVFYDCNSLISVTIPNSVTTIGENAFNGCSGLTSVTIPNSVTSIGEGAFYYCSSLYSVSIGTSVASIGSDAFNGCYINILYYNAEDCADIKENDYVFQFWGSVIIGKDVKRVPDYLFYKSYPLQVVSQSVTPPACGENAFSSDGYNGKLYVPSEGVFSYQFADGWSKFSSINGIEKPITGITLSESNLTLKVKDVKTISATITPADATIPDAYYWTSSNNNVAIVKMDYDDNYNWVPFITAVAEGTAVISAISYDGGDVVATCNVTVKSNKATSISLSATELKIAKNGTATLTYTILPEDVEVKTAEWIVSDESILIYKVNDDGSILIGGKSEGTATVTARTTDGSNLEATCVVTVGATGVEGVETSAARIYSANGNIIIAAAEDGEAAVYDYTGRLIKSVSVVAGDNTAVPVMPGCYIVRTGVKTQSVVVK